MKRLTRPQRRRFLIRKRQLSALKQQRRRYRKRSRRGASRTVLRHLYARRQSWKEVEAPRIFSLRDRPQEATEFLVELHRAARDYRQIYIRLGGVHRVTLEALGLLLSRIKSAPRGTRFRGDSPQNEKPRSFIEASGFFAHVDRVDGRPAQEQGLIVRNRTAKRVSPDDANKMIQKISDQIQLPLLSSKASYSTLIEAMSNTHDHAGGTDRYGTESWWLMTFAETQASVAHFAIIDNGVGIFRSVKLRRYLRFLRGLHVRNQGDILRMILEGEIQSSTGLSYRGKGLPSIVDRQRRGLLSDLLIISNDAYAAVDIGEFRTISPGLKGTLITWTVKGGGT